MHQLLKDILISVEFYPEVIVEGNSLFEAIDTRPEEIKRVGWLQSLTELNGMMATTKDVTKEIDRWMSCFDLEYRLNCETNCYHIRKIQRNHVL